MDGAVDGTSQARTFHRAELQGQVGIFLMVAMLARFYNIAKGHIKTYCDNKPVVTKMQKGWQLLRLRHTKGPDTDLQIQMRAIQATLGQITSKTEWVRRAIRINLYSTLLDQWHEAEAKEYLLSRHNIDATLFEKIQRRSMTFALLKFSYHRRATMVKAIHRHLPTQDKLYQQGRVTMCAMCPRCISQAETNAHVYSCLNPDALKSRLKDCGELHQQLVKLNTATIIQRTWAVHLRPLLALPSTDLLETIILGTTGEVRFFLQAAIAEQERIGWDKLLLGMGTSLWQTIQYLIDKDNPKPPRRSAADWMNRAIYQLAKFSLRCWKSRNQAVHGTNYKECKQKALDRARQRIKEIYEHPPTLAPTF